MYVPKHFEQPSVEAMHGLMRANPLATLVAHGADGLCANHIPVELKVDPLPYGSLLGHVPRSNPLWRGCSGDAEVMLIFHGPSAYISPSWYASKSATGKVVPTWNYAVVHAYGRIRPVEDAQWIKAHIERLTDSLEGAFAHPWAVSDAPSDFTDKLIESLVGIEILLTKLVGKWKASQNRSDADRAGVMAGLRATGDPQAALMADLVELGERYTR